MMTDLLRTLEIVALVFSGFYLAYLALLSLIALAFKDRQGPLLKHAFRRFAIIVPAHNEALNIRRTVLSLLAIDYPRRLFEVYVVADNCTDETADIARSSGAFVLERHDPEHRSKGHALAWSTSLILQRRQTYDAFVVIDADSIVMPSFLRVMHGHLDAGAEVIQGADIVDPKPGPWSPEVSRISFLLFNVVKQMGRTAVGLSAGLRGNGMCFTADLFRRIPWNTFSLAEDMDYSLILVEHGVPIAFARNAVVHTTMPSDPAHAELQRARWEAGRYPLLKQHTWPLIRRLFRKPSFHVLDALVDLYTPPFTNLVAIALLGASVRIVATMSGIDPDTTLSVAWLLVLALGMTHVVAGLFSVNQQYLLGRSLKLFPRYLFWKFRLYLRVFSTAFSGEWIRTPRERSQASSTE